MKKILSLATAVMMLIGMISTAAAYDSVEINGMEYRLSTTDNYTDLSKVEQQAKFLYDALEDHPEVRTYVYLINSSRTVNVKDNISAVPVVYEAIEKYFSKSTTDYLHLDSLERYAEYYYTTDHHWNYKGSYAGYCQIIRMLLGPDEPLMEPVEEVTFPVKFNGSINRDLKVQDSKELFTVYRFDYPEMKIVINGVPKASYGNQQVYFDGKYSRLEKINHYAKFYGGDTGIVHIQTDRTDRGTLVVFSNSFSNPITQLLASHYHDLWVIDFRYYLAGQDKDFSFSEILNSGDVQVLLLGDGVFFSQANPYHKLRHR